MWNPALEAAFLTGAGVLAGTAGSAGAIGELPVLAGIDALTILGESDKSGTNEANALACARRWRAAGQEAEIVFPTIDGDMNDLVKR